MATVDLMQELKDIERLAKEGQRALVEGTAKNGRTKLRTIEERAQDAVRHGETGASGETGRA